MIEEGRVYLLRLRAEELTMIRQVFMQDGRVRLQPLDPTVAPDYTDLGNVDFYYRVLCRIGHHS